MVILLKGDNFFGICFFFFSIMRISKISNMFFRLNNKFYKFNYVSSLVQSFMRRGLRMRSANIIYSFLFKIKSKFKVKKVNEILEIVFERYVPVVSFVSRKVAANVYFLPWFIKRDRARSVLIRWFLRSAMERSEVSMVGRLYGEFLDICAGYGRTVRRLEEYYKLALDNRPFFRYLRRRKKSFTGRLRKFGIKLRRR